MRLWAWLRRVKLPSSPRSKRKRMSLQDLPVEVILTILGHLDTLSLYQLAHTSRGLRALIIRHTGLWRVLELDPNAKLDSVLLSLLGFLIAANLHHAVEVAYFDQTAIDLTSLERVLRQLRHLTHLSLVDCPRMDSWQILSLLKAAGKADGSGFLKDLTRLDIRGSFPSERSHKSHGHEMYCYGEIKKVLLAFRGKQDGSHHPQPWQELSEGHYALYQFWLLLRSRMMLAPPTGAAPQDVMDDDDTDDDTSVSPDDFRPPWLPDTLIQFIQVTESNDPAAPVKIDLEACRLCHKNVAHRDSLTTCKACGTETAVSCAQCMCLRCEGVLCVPCYRRHCYRLHHGLPPTTPSSSSSSSSWRVVCCRQCLLSRRVCNDAACQREPKYDNRWYCRSCCQQRATRWKPRARSDTLPLPGLPNGYLHWAD